MDFGVVKIRLKSVLTIRSQHHAGCRAGCDTLVRGVTNDMVQRHLLIHHWRSSAPPSDPSTGVATPVAGSSGLTIGSGYARDDHYWKGKVAMFWKGCQPKFNHLQQGGRWGGGIGQAGSLGADFDTLATAPTQDGCGQDALQKQVLEVRRLRIPREESGWAGACAWHANGEDFRRMERAVP
jgi:hypothetical protein